MAKSDDGKDGCRWYCDVKRELVALHESVEGNDSKVGSQDEWYDKEEWKRAKHALRMILRENLVSS